MSAPVDLDAIERWLDPAAPEMWSQAMRDEALVLHAREDVPALVAEVRALRAKIERVEALVEMNKHKGFITFGGNRTDGLVGCGDIEEALNPRDRSERVS